MENELLTQLQNEKTRLMGKIPFKDGDFVEYLGKSGVVLYAYVTDKLEPCVKVAWKCDSMPTWSSNVAFISKDEISKIKKINNPFSAELQERLEYKASGIAWKIKKKTEILRKHSQKIESMLAENRNKCIHKWEQSSDVLRVRKGLLGDNEVCEYTCVFCGKVMESI